MKTFTLALVVALLACSTGCHSHRSLCEHSAPHDHERDLVQAHDQIEAMLLATATAWTDNDIDAFMAGYHNSPDLRFAIPSGVLLGWQPLYDRYSTRIANSDLRFSDLDIQVLSPDAAFVFGRFHNTMRDGSYATGLYTLLVRKIDGRWVIVHDHSSDLPADYEG